MTANEEEKETIKEDLKNLKNQAESHLRKGGSFEWLLDENGKAIPALGITMIYVVATCLSVFTTASNLWIVAAMLATGLVMHFAPLRQWFRQVSNYFKS